VAGPTIRIVIDAVADGLERAAKKAGDTVDKLGTKLGKSNKQTEEASGFFNRLGGAARGAAGDGLGPLGDAAGALGVDLDGMSTKGLVAGAAVAALGTAAVASVKSYIDLTERVRAFRDASGLSTEAASRFVAVLDDLGVNTESAQSSLLRLSRSVDAGKLDEYGIAVARTASGTVDMAGTLGNVADALTRTSDPTKRAAMGTDLLGKSYASLTPLLELGSDGIREWTEGVSDAQVVTEQSLRDTREFSVALDGLQESATDVGLAFGKEVVPVLTEAIKGLSDGISVLKEWDAWSKNRDGFRQKLEAEGYKETGILIRRYVKASEEAAEASFKTQTAAERQAAAYAELGIEVKTAKELSEDQAEALKEEEAAQQALIKGINDRRKAQQDLTKAIDDQKLAVLGLADKELAQERAQRTFTETLAELEEGSEDYAEQLDDVKDAALGAAAAEVELGKQRETAAGRIPTVDQALKIERDAYQNLLDKASDPQLREFLQRLIDRIDKIAGDAAKLDSAIRNAGGLSDYIAAYAELGIDVPLPGRAAGGPVMAGRAYTVGEVGPELFVPQSNGRILSADDLARVGGGGGQGVTIVVNSPIGKPDDVVRWLREELRRLDRGQR
jgi:hypothetical protein